MKKLIGRVTITRDSNDIVRISFRDECSRIEFAEARMTVEDFGFAITGLAEQPASVEVRGLEYVGKRQVNESRSIECPLKTYDREELSAWLMENAREDGWIVNGYLGSQGSVGYRDGKTILNYGVTKYVEAE